MAAHKRSQHAGMRHRILGDDASQSDVLRLQLGILNIRLYRDAVLKLLVALLLFVLITIQVFHVVSFSHCDGHGGRNNRTLERLVRHGIGASKNAVTAAIADSTIQPKAGQPIGSPMSKSKSSSSKTWSCVLIASLPSEHQRKG